MNRSGIIWTIITCLAGILVTIIFYEIQRNKIEVVYSIKNSPTIIFDSKIMNPKIRLLINDSIEVSKDIYVTTIVFWNSGNQEIKKQDIRNKLRFVVKNNGEFIDYKILSETDPTISKFFLKQVDSLIYLDWEYFDPKFGAEIQIFYSGSEKSEVVLDGRILNGKIDKVEAKTSYDFLVPIVLSIATLLVFGFITYEERNDKRIRNVMIITIVITLLFIVLALIVPQLFEYHLPL